MKKAGSTKSSQLQVELALPSIQSPKNNHIKPSSEVWAPLKPTPVLDVYWRFAVERQDIFFRRNRGFLPPWTDDPILREHKFTNAYRASDRVSQYLIQRVIYAGRNEPEEVFFRTLLFKFFNKIETWELLQDIIGEPTWQDFSFKKYDAVLNEAMASGERIYSAAYIMPTGGRGTCFDRKHRLHLSLLEKMLCDDLPSQIRECGTMGRAFDLLRSYPTIGDFLAYQYITDLNYSEIVNFTEMEFVVAGPGAKDGISKCFYDTAGLSEAEVIRLMAERQEAEFARLGLRFQNLWGRRLQLIDCQNLFCEVSKYSRVSHPEIAGLSGRTRIKQKFRPQVGSLLLWYPPKWGINPSIKPSA
jgi:hypothetical protein